MTKMVLETGFKQLVHRKRIKPPHWTIGFQNWAIGTKKPKFVIDFFYLKNPLLLVLFGVVDVFQLLLFGKASDVSTSPRSDRLRPRPVRGRSYFGEKMVR